MNAGLIRAEHRGQIAGLLFTLYPALTSRHTRVWIAAATGTPLGTPLARLTDDQAQALITALRRAQSRTRPLGRRRAPQHRRAAA